MKLNQVCLANSIRRADRVVSQYYNEYLAPVGLKITQFSVLHTLFHLHQVTARQLQEAMVMEQATISRALKPLIRDGYVNEAEGTDKREKILTLSKQGHALHDEAVELWQQAQDSFRAHLGEGLDADLVTMSQHIVTLKKKRAG